MKKISNLCLMMAMLLLSTTWACKEKNSDEPPVVTEEKFEVDKAHRSFEVDRTAASFDIPVVTDLPYDKWKVDVSDRWLQVSKKRVDENNSLVNVRVQANETGAKRTGTITLTTEQKKTITISVVQYGKSEVIVDEDIRVKPTDARASEYQNASQSIQKSIDGDYETHYHSSWSNTRFPVKLEYFFKGDEQIDYVIYHTRNGNGNFGKLSLYVATDAAHTYEKVGDYDFGEKSAPSTVNIPGSKKPTAVKFEVHSGLGGFASCAEMEFYRANGSKTLETKLLTVFTDATCTELKPNVTDEQIEALGEYFARVARAIRDNSYDPYEKEFRIRSYEGYSNNVEWASRLIINKYTHLDNPTGISVKQGDEVIVCVGDVEGGELSMQCLWEENVSHSAGNYRQTASYGTSYVLRPGINKLTMSGEGQLFLIYTVADPTVAKPVKVHIPLGSGTVTGFFDLKEHKTDERYAELLRKATHKYFCVRGERLMFYFHRNKMPNQILSAINLWDDIIKWEQELCGIEKYMGKQFNNHVFAISPEANNGQMYMWASDYRIAFIYTYLNNILLKDNVMAAADNAWGPAHEIGHVHQKAVNWPSATESSNNLFSNYVIYKLGKYGSRGSGLLELARAVGDAKDGAVTWLAIAQNGYGDVHNRMWWQLWNYYHRLGNNKEFWPEVYELMRERASTFDANNPGHKQIEFAKACCDVAGEDLSEFFELWGFLTPVSTTMSDYGDYNYRVTQSMVDDARKYMSKYPKQKQPIQYIEDRKKAGWPSGQYTPAEIGDLGFFETFEKNLKLSDDISAKVSGRNVTISNGNEAVAIEVRKGGSAGPVLYFSNFLTFEIPSKVSTSGASLYAVQADGTRKFLKNL